MGPPGPPFHRFSELGLGYLKLRGGGKQECLLYLTYLLMVLAGYCYWNELALYFFQLSTKDSKFQKVQIAQGGSLHPLLGYPMESSPPSILC